MPEYPLELATRQLRRTFERAIGKSIAKILTELVTNSDDSYKRLIRSGKKNSDQTVLEDPAPIIILFERTKKRLSVIDHAEGLSDKEMRDRFVSYGEESTDRAKGYKTRSLFGKGLRDVLFTQKHGQVKSIKNELFYNCRFRWKDASGRERNWKLAWVSGLFNMAGLDVRDIPDVGRIFAERVTAEFAFMRSFVVSLTWIFLRYSYRIEVEFVVFALREPKNRLMASAKAVTCVNTVAEGPDNSVSKEEVVLLRKDVINKCIQWNDDAVLNVVSNLPTKAASIFEGADK
jgi:hypothetical protein